MLQRFVDSLHTDIPKLAFTANCLNDVSELFKASKLIKNQEYIKAEVYSVLELIEKESGYKLIDSVKENIAHIVESHHGKWGKVQPETEEANLVYIADMESAKYHLLE